MCGEKPVRMHTRTISAGSPPHVRGKVVGCVKLCLVLGITPACAGKSRQEKFSKLPGEDHPRMCGEKHHLVNDIGHIGGSPPHVRGKDAVKRHRSGCIGITPACAGKRLKRSRSTVPPVAIVPLFPSVCNKPVVSDGSPAGRDAPLFLPAENAVPASPAYNLRSL